MMERRDRSKQVSTGSRCPGAAGTDPRHLGLIAHFVMPIVLATFCFVGFIATPTRADAVPCPNEQFRIGPSATLPDCRAYELITPADKGRTQALTFTGGATRALVSGDGNAVALETLVPFGPNPSSYGTRAVFKRNPTLGWEMHSAVEPNAGFHVIRVALFSRDLSQVAFEWETALNLGEISPDVTFEAGPVGGPYEAMARIPQEEAQLLGSSANFSHVLFASVDRKGLLSETEDITAEATSSGATDLYEWTGGDLHLVNATTEGLPMVNTCGATLGGGPPETSASATLNAVSEDGSKIFFTNPFPWRAASSEPGCKAPAELYMRVNNGEPIEVSAPESGVSLKAAEIEPVRYNYATSDGSKVFFNTETPLTADETTQEKGENKLFEYDTEAPEGERLKLVAAGVPQFVGVGMYGSQGFTFSEDGSVVYVEPPIGGGGRLNIYRIDTSSGERTSVAAALEASDTGEPSYSTPSGAFFLFTSRGVEVPFEPRGFGHNEMYRYEKASGRVMCVTCGKGAAPEQGEVVRRKTILETADVATPLTQLSENGQTVFFQTTARLVPQDVNSTETNISSVSGTSGLDVYEWDADSSGGCESSQGCTYLLSTGEDVGPSTLLGASKDGSNVFFESAAQLIAEDVDEFPDIYDARVGGGFAPSAPTLECTSCQGVGSPPPLFDVPASGTFMGAGNPGLAGEPTTEQELTKALKACRKGRPRRRRAACEKRVRRRYGTIGSKAKRSAAHTTKGRR